MLEQNTLDSAYPFRRSAATMISKQACFFCGDSRGKDLHEIRSLNAGVQIRQAVNASENMQWEIKLSIVLDTT